MPVDGTSASDQERQETKVKKCIAILSSAFHHYRKEVTCFCLAMLLIGGGIALGFPSKDDYDEVKSASVLVCVFGEGFETVCNLAVNVHFTDTGKVTFQFNPFDSGTVPQTVWVNIFSSPDHAEFAWTLSGNVEHRKMFYRPESNLVTLSLDPASEGTGYFMEFFKITVDSDGIPEEIYLQLDPEDVIYQYDDIIRICAPHIASMLYNPDIIPNGEFNMTELFQEFGKDAFERTFSFGKIDGQPLTSALLQITGTYDSEKFYYDSSYKLEHISPISYKRELQSVAWEPELFTFTPIIEYKAKNSGVVDSFIAFLMISVGSFFLPISLERLYADAMESKGKRRKKRKG